MSDKDTQDALAQRDRYHANLNFMDAFELFERSLSTLIMATPTGAERELQTDLQIRLGDWKQKRAELTAV